ALAGEGAVRAVCALGSEGAALAGEGGGRVELREGGGPRGGPRGVDAGGDAQLGGAEGRERGAPLDERRPKLTNALGHAYIEAPT
ncbi:MAG: hypothetical protein EBU46_17645, partial [Nitrosomonadaceae bacterium]|nr:hypothetical protein [Nitrosomonadaceae bacterium]